jgi:hypothetical protein
MGPGSEAGTTFVGVHRADRCRRYFGCSFSAAELMQ